MDSRSIPTTEDAFFNDMVEVLRRAAASRGLVFYLGPPNPEFPVSGVRTDFTVGNLRLSISAQRAFWKERKVDLTLTEFKIVYLLATHTERDVSYREIYDVARGAGFAAGHGECGYMVNVRAFIKRIRQKFGEIEDTFSQIATYPGFGYRWTAEEPEPVKAVT